jgi:uncharacterized membrane protein
MPTRNSNETADDLPPHVGQSVQAIAKLRAAHEERATPMERVVDRLTAVVAQPSFIGVVILMVGLWIGGNLALRRVSGWSLDGAAFPWLQGAGELAALLITTLVLISQRRKDELSALREQLTLELAITTEQKGAKLIALMEELRRDHPQLVDRIDAEAEQMSKPADPEVVLDALKETDAEPDATAEDDAEPLG